MEVDVETLGVQGLFEGDRSLDLLAQHLIEIDVGKEGVTANLLCVMGVAQSLLRLEFE